MYSWAKVTIESNKAIKILVAVMISMLMSLYIIINTQGQGPIGGITVEPENPTMDDIVFVTLSGYQPPSECGGPPPNYCFVTPQSNNVLKVTAILTGFWPPVCIPNPSPIFWSCTSEVGQLSPGLYTAEGYVGWRFVGSKIFDVTPPPITTTISSSGGSLVSNELGVNTSIYFPPDAVADGTVITYTRRWTSTLPHSLRSTDYFFALETNLQGSANFEFNKPVTTSIHYLTPTENLNWAEDFELYLLHNSDWVTEGITLIERTNDSITNTINQAGLFSVLIQTQPVYLPLILK